jgi:hypothetical protein
MMQAETPAAPVGAVIVDRVEVLDVVVVELPLMWDDFLCASLLEVVGENFSHCA